MTTSYSWLNFFQSKWKFSLPFMNDCSSLDTFFENLSQNIFIDSELVFYYILS